MVDTLACEARFCEFKSHRLIHRTLTQLVEYPSDTRVADGSNPSRPTIFCFTFTLTYTIGCVILKLFKEIISALTRLTNYLHRESNPKRAERFFFVDKYVNI